MTIWSITEPPQEASTLQTVSSCRWTLSLICYILTNTMRSNINIAIVCMVKSPNTSHSNQSNMSSYQDSETCNRQHSESDEIKVWKLFSIVLAILRENILSQELQIARHSWPLISKMDSKLRYFKLNFLHYNADQIISAFTTSSVHVFVPTCVCKKNQEHHLQNTYIPRDLMDWLNGIKQHKVTSCQHSLSVTHSHKLCLAC